MCHVDPPPGQRPPTVHSAEVEIDVGSERMPALHVGADPSAPAVLIVGDVFGRSPFYEHLAARLAEAGFQAVVPDFFFRQGPLAPPVSKESAFARRAALDEGRSLGDLSCAIAWLRDRSAQTRIGTIGFCMGGTFVLDLASMHTGLVTVAYYGFPVPPATVASPPPRPLDLVAELNGPVLAFWGAEDDTVGIPHVRDYVARAAVVNVDFDYEIVPGLGHGFLGSSRLEDPTDEGGRTWARTLGHFRRHLAAG